jgi:hypothetical protein
MGIPDRLVLIASRPAPSHRVYDLLACGASARDRPAPATERTSRLMRSPDDEVLARIDDAEAWTCCDSWCTPRAQSTGSRSARCRGSRRVSRGSRLRVPPARDRARPSEPDSRLRHGTSGAHPHAQWAPRHDAGRTRLDDRPLRSRRARWPPLRSRGGGSEEWPGGHGRRRHRRAWREAAHPGTPVAHGRCRRRGFRAGRAETRRAGPPRRLRRNHRADRARARPREQWSGQSRATRAWKERSRQRARIGEERHRSGGPRHRGARRASPSPASAGPSADRSDHAECRNDPGRACDLNRPGGVPGDRRSPRHPGGQHRRRGRRPG